MRGTSTLVGVFDTRQHATEAVRDLRQAGFEDSRIGVLSRNENHPANKSGLEDDPTNTRWEEGSGIGAAAGAVTGTGLGLAVAAGLIPGIGPLIAGGTLVALLASAGAGATAGTILGALVGLGIPEEDATYYEGKISAGKTLLSVDAGDRYTEAAAILRRHGAELRTHEVGAAY